MNDPLLTHSHLYATVDGVDYFAFITATSFGFWRMLDGQRLTSPAYHKESNNGRMSLQLLWEGNSELYPKPSIIEQFNELINRIANETN